MSLPTFTFRRASTCLHPPSPTPHPQIRHASLLRRPHRPYTFTQLVALSDGSVYTQRTTSPLTIYKSTKDTRNHMLWNPSLTSLRNIEEDEAGRLKAFRDKFGRGWDVDGGMADADGEGEGDGGGAGEAARDEQDSLMDLMSSAYAATEARDMSGRVQGPGAGAGTSKKKKGKK